MWQVATLFLFEAHRQLAEIHMWSMVWLSRGRNGLRNGLAAEPRAVRVNARILASARIRT